MVGPDGIEYKRNDPQGDEQRQGKPGGTLPGKADSGSTDKPSTAGGGTANGTPSDASKPDPAQPPGTQDQKSPPREDANKLFRPEQGTPQRNSNSTGGTRPGQGSGPGGGAGKPSDETDPNGDLTEQAAARRLRQVIERIEKRRDGRPQPAVPGNGNTPSSDKKRDW